jgi:hypothetical protein
VPSDRPRRPPVPEPVREGLLWHYTDAGGFLGIVATSGLWASAPQSLNDQSELAYGEAVVRETWGRADTGALSAAGVEFVEQVLSRDMAADMREDVFVLSTAWTATCSTSGSTTPTAVASRSGSTRS